MIYDHQATRLPYRLIIFRRVAARVYDRQAGGGSSGHRVGPSGPFGSGAVRVWRRRLSAGSQG